MAATEDSCQDAVEWLSDFDATGSTCTLDALRVRFVCLFVCLFVCFCLFVCLLFVVFVSMSLKSCNKLSWFYLFYRQIAFDDPEVQGIYLLTDGKPVSKSLCLPPACQSLFLFLFVCLFVCFCTNDKLLTSSLFSCLCMVEDTV